MYVLAQIGIDMAFIRISYKMEDRFRNQQMDLLDELLKNMFKSHIRHHEIL